MGSFGRIRSRAWICVSDRRTHPHVIRRIDEAPFNIADLLDEEGITGQREDLGPVRLHARQAEPLERGLAETPSIASVLSVLQWGALGTCPASRSGSPGDPLVVVSARAAGAEFVVQALGAAVEIALTLLADGLHRSADQARDRSVSDTLRTGEIMWVHSRGMGRGGEFSSTWHRNLLGAWKMPLDCTKLPHRILERHG